MILLAAGLLLFGLGRLYGCVRRKSIEQQNMLRPLFRRTGGQRDVQEAHATEVAAAEHQRNSTLVKTNLSTL